MKHFRAKWCWQRLALTTLVGFCLTGTAQAQSYEAELVADAQSVLDEFAHLPVRTIPETLLNNAQGIVVIPSMLKAGLGVGARHGRGVLLVRQESGDWGNPLFIAMTGASLGWQFGVQASDLVLVFKTRRGVTSLLEGHKFTLGPDAGVAIGPVGRQAEVATDPRLRSEIYAFARSRGLFMGITLEGSSLRLARRANEAFYGRPLESWETILSRTDVPAAEGIARLKAAVDPKLARVPVPDDGSRRR